jgi:hypothetical protein
MPTKRTLTRQLAAAQDRIRRLVDERDEAREDLASRRWAEQHLPAQSDLVIARTRERDAAQRLLRETEDQLAEVRRLLANRPAPARELQQARREALEWRDLAKELTRRLEVLQAANEAKDWAPAGVSGP